MSEKKLPKVALIGRPNVGKSTLFNRLIEEQKAIVFDQPGVTRDRQYGECEWNGLKFEVIDTGGFEPKTDDKILAAMRRQTEQAIEEADAIVFVVDGREGVLAGDLEIIDLLRRREKPFILAVNKLDTIKMELLASEFYAIGIENIFPISALHGSGVGDLLDLLVELLRRQLNLPSLEEIKNSSEWLSSEDIGPKEDELTTESIPKIAVIGRPNVGKSTLINKLLGEERLLALPTPGTTRDTVDVEIERKNKRYLFLDTAGLRRKKYIRERLEKEMIHRTVRAIERSDIVLLLLNVEEGITEQDAKVAGIAHNRGRGIIILVNKWDTVKTPREARKQFLEEMDRKLRYLSYAPLLFCSAKTGYNLNKLFPLIDKVHSNYYYRVTTGKLNRFFEKILRDHPPPTYRGRAIKFYYITQAQVAPPLFIISANYPDAANISYQRFIINRIRTEFGFEGIPIQLKFKSRH